MSRTLTRVARASVLCAVTGLVVSGCSTADRHLMSAPPDSVASNGIGNPPPPGIFTTNGTAYTASVINGSNTPPRYGFTVITRYANPMSSPIYLSRCFPTSPTPIYGVLLVGQTDPGGAAYNQAWGCVGHDQQILVASGATRVDTLQLIGPNFLDGKTGAPIGTAEGRFRLSYAPMSCPDAARCGIVADSLRLSNEFTVRLPK